MDMETKRPSLLFIYGTLRKGTGHAMAHYLARNAINLGPAKAPGRLYDLGKYPGMLPAREELDWVRGEVCELRDADEVLAVLDEYEGCTNMGPHADLFRRAQTEVILADGRRGLAWVYYYCREVGEDQRILAGDYSVKET